MKTRRKLCTGLLRTAAVVLGVLVSTSMVLYSARAETLSRHQPGALLQAERALEQGQPERALSHLHRQRAVLRFGKFRSRSAALACQAYLQMQDFLNGARVCDEVAAHGSDGAIAKAYDPSDGRFNFPVRVE